MRQRKIEIDRRRSQIEKKIDRIPEGTPVTDSRLAPLLAEMTVLSAEWYEIAGKMISAGYMDAYKY